MSFALYEHNQYNNLGGGFLMVRGSKIPVTNPYVLPEPGVFPFSDRTGRSACFDPRLAERQSDETDFSVTG